MPAQLEKPLETVGLLAAAASRTLDPAVIKRGAALYGRYLRVRLFGSPGIDKLYFLNGRMARRDSRASREARRERPELQAGGPLVHQLGNLRV